MLRTNLTAGSTEELWSKYMQLTEAEASFRTLKSELSIRPLFHQKEPRVKDHIMVAFLSYALWVTLKHLLKRRPAIVPKAIGQWRGQRSASVPDEGAGSAIHAAECRHRPADDRWTRDPAAPDHRTDRGTEIPASSARPQLARPSQFLSKM
jgi:hypothetical protein